MPVGTILPNSWIFLRLPSESHKVVQLVPSTVIGLGKFGSFKADSLIGEKFGYTYEISAENTIIKADQPQFDLDDKDDVTTQTMSGDQIEYLGTNTLTMKEIEQLKKEGTKGEEIIKQIVDSHKDFEKKTEFAKAKYLKRKKAKYLQQFTPEPVSSQQLLELYLEKDRSKVMNMGLESLAMLLSLANVRQGGHYLVVDETPSLLVVAILEKLGGHGSVTIAHENEHTNLDALKYFTDWYPKEDPDIESPLVRTINLLELLKPESRMTSEPRARETTNNPAESSNSDSSFQNGSHASSLPIKFGNEDPKTLKAHQRAQYNRQLYRYKQRQWIDAKCTEGFDGLIVATTLDPADLLPRLLPFVSGSAPLVVFSEFKERLVDLTLAMKSDLRVLAPTIWETRVRKYQTLPGRIHPRMTSQSLGGYLLHATSVYPSDAVHALGAGAQRKRKKKNPEDQSRQASEAASDISEAFTDQVDETSRDASMEP